MKSQARNILEYLLDNESITPLEALNLFGCLSLAQRIKNLRDDGHPIKTTMVRTAKNKMIASYSYDHSEVK